jgi:hypothetical protein
MPNLHINKFINTVFIIKRYKKEDAYTSVRSLEIEL